MTIFGKKRPRASRSDRMSCHGIVCVNGATIPKAVINVSGRSAWRCYSLVPSTARNAAPKVVNSPRTGSIGAINLAIRRERG